MELGADSTTLARAPGGEPAAADVAPPTSAPELTILMPCRNEA